MYKKTVLENGLTVATESLPYLSTVSVGLFWKTGSRYETESENGMSHFIEHMLFKGTQRRSASDIAIEMDKIGGSINAFTGKEYASLYGKVLRRDVDVMLEIFQDMCLNSLFREEDIEREKDVIKQEIKMTEDSPEEYIYDAFHAHFFKGHPLGFPILGKEENIGTFDRAKLLEFYRRHYGVGSLLIVAAGKLDHEEFVSKVRGLFGLEVAPQGAEQGCLTEPTPTNGIEVIEKDLEHIYLLIGMKGVSQKDDRRYALYVLNTVMGGSMSSHLFQEIRERRGLVYNIYSYVSCFQDAGTFAITTSTSREYLEEVLRLVKEEMRRVRDEGLTDEELSFSKKHIKGNLLLSLESSEARMGRLAKNEIYFGRYIPLKETIRQIEKIEKADVDEMARRLFASFDEISVTLLGSVEKETVEEIWKN